MAPHLKPVFQPDQRNIGEGTYLRLTLKSAAFIISTVVTFTACSVAWGMNQTYAVARLETRLTRLEEQMGRFDTKMNVLIERLPIRPPQTASIQTRSEP